MMEPPTKEAAVIAISVFWDIKKCPFPDDYDARRVGPCFKRFLRKLGYSGPVTVTAVGVLSKVPDKILEAVSSSGISLYNGPYYHLNESGCNIFLPFPFDSSASTDAKSLWQNSLLADPEEDKCSETGEPAFWVCAVCHKLSGRGFENFITHVSTREHEWKLPQWFPDEEAVEANVDAPLDSFPENATTMASEDEAKKKMST